MTKNKNRCRFKFFMLGLIALLMLSACTSARSQDLVEAMGFNTPEEWIISEYSIGPMSDPVILSRRRLANGLLYLFTFQSANKYGNKDESFAFRLFIHNPVEQASQRIAVQVIHVEAPHLVRRYSIMRY